MEIGPRRGEELHGGRPGKQGKHSRFRYAMVQMLAYFFLTSLRFGMS